MSDRTSAEVFAALFDITAHLIPPSDIRDRFVRRIWDLSRGYDFSDEQLECDDSLMKLGLARKWVDPKRPDEESMAYGPVDPPPDPMALIAQTVSLLSERVNQLHADVSAHVHNPRVHK